jgi:hypothetical protein
MDDQDQYSLKALNFRLRGMHRKFQPGKVLEGN